MSWTRSPRTIVAAALLIVAVAGLLLLLAPSDPNADGGMPATTERSSTDVTGAVR